MGYLVIKGNNQTRSYSLANNVPAKPYLKVSSGYLSLTTADTTGLRLNVKANNTTYRPMQSSSYSVTNTASSTYTNSSTNSNSYTQTVSNTYTSTNSAHTTTRKSTYSVSTPDGTGYYGAKQAVSTSYTTTWQVSPVNGTASYAMSFCNNYNAVYSKLTAQVWANCYTYCTAGLVNYSAGPNSATQVISGQFLNGVTYSKNGYLTSVRRSFTNHVQKGAVYIVSQYVATRQSIKTNRTMEQGSGSTWGTISCSTSMWGSGAKQLLQSVSSSATSMTRSATLSKSQEASKTSQYTDYYYTQTSSNTKTLTNTNTVTNTRTSNYTSSTSQSVTYV